METRRNHNYINGQANTESPRPDDGYLELGNVTDENRPVESKGGYVPNQRLGSTVQYESIDYDILRKDDPRQDQHTYRGLKFDSDEVTRNNTTRANPIDKEDKISERTTEHKKRGNMVFIFIIILLVVVLVAMAATFGILYTDLFDKDGLSKAQPLRTEKTSTSATTLTLPTTRVLTTEETTLTKTTKSTTATTRSTTPPTTTTSTTQRIHTEGLSIEERCRIYDGLIPHPDECQAYYNCSDTSLVNTSLMNTNFEPYLNECPYPELFNTETMKCEHYSYVTCGDRVEAKDGCEYRAIRCSSSHCIPCEYRYPRCKGKEDGLNMNDGKPWTPWYTICYDGRLIAEMSCEWDPVSELAQFFSPEYNRCVPLDRIPQEHGGYLPNCTSKADGFYPNNYKRCNVFTVCALEQYLGFGFCKDGQAFDEVSKSCKVASLAVTCECQTNC